MLRIVDYMDSPEERREATEPEELPESFGRNLDTIEKARRWLTNPRNWFTSELFILRWDGLLPRISRRHGERLVRETWDDGLPWVVVREQRLLRGGTPKEHLTTSPGEELEDMIDSELERLLNM